MAFNANRFAQPQSNTTVSPAVSADNYPYPRKLPDSMHHGGRSHVLGWSTIFQGGQHFYTMDIVRRYWRRGSLDVPAPFFVHAHDFPGAAFSDSGEDCASSTYFSSGDD